GRDRRRFADTCAEAQEILHDPLKPRGPCSEVGSQFLEPQSHLTAHVPIDRRNAIRKDPLQDWNRQERADWLDQCQPVVVDRRDSSPRVPHEGAPVSSGTTNVTAAGKRRNCGLEYRLRMAFCSRAISPGIS